MSIGYTWEKLYRAMLALAHSDGTLEHRLASAYQAMHMLTPEDFPDEELRQDYTTLIGAWRTEAGTRLHGTMAPSRTVLPPDQARTIAERLLRLYTDITRLEEQYYRSFSTRDL